MDSDDPTAVRKLQKAGREKQRRCRLNEQFIELGTTLDAERPKNDKATILTDTIQLLKDLTAEVDKLKAEHTALSDESRELTQEKNDLREEKTALKSDIDRLSSQCQQRAGPAYPWVAMDSVLQHPPSYPYPMPMPVPTGAVPMHLSMQPYPFFGNPNPGMYANPCSTFIPYMAPNLPAEQPSTQDVSPPMQPGRTQVSAGHGVGTSSDKHDGQVNKKDDSSDVPTNLELKTPGSTTDENTSSGNRKKRIAAEGSSLSRCSSHSVQDSSSSSIVGGGKGND
ncbi:transcription factor bHLH121-like [Chenopodium quinoa]|uniref:BHLH domain-containing protein n=1 Tax=Chenopodium quinoa TaxID=63459 RepID=A0A803LGJ6_CHEQI|nr:transcription factor bHLH121-like [Chenopodium quinoa]